MIQKVLQHHTFNEAADSMVVKRFASKYSPVLLMQKPMPMPVMIRITSVQTNFQKMELVLYKYPYPCREVEPQKSTKTWLFSMFDFFNISLFHSFTLFCGFLVFFNNLATFPCMLIFCWSINASLCKQWM